MSESVSLSIRTEARPDREADRVAADLDGRPRRVPDVPRSASKNWCPPRRSRGAGTSGRAGGTGRSASPARFRLALREFRDRHAVAGDELLVDRLDALPLGHPAQDVEAVAIGQERLGELLDEPLERVRPRSDSGSFSQVRKLGACFRHRRPLEAVNLSPSKKSGTAAATFLVAVAYI